MFQRRLNFPACNYVNLIEDSTCIVKLSFSTTSPPLAFLVLRVFPVRKFEALGRYHKVLQCGESRIGIITILTVGLA